MTKTTTRMNEDEARQVARRFMDAQGFRSGQAATACMSGFLTAYAGKEPQPYGGAVTIKAYRLGYAAGQEAAR